MLSRYRDDVRAWSDPVGRTLFRLRLRPNHLTVMGLAVSLLAAAAFIAGHTQGAGVLLIVAGLFDLFDGSLARASGQVTAFGAFLDSVIDRYSDLVVLLGIVVFFARTPHARGALVAMAGLVGSVMVSYTKARAQSIGIDCNVGVMERPERMICLIVGALFGLMEPALWVLAVLANITALQRIVYTRRQLQRRTLEPTILGALALVCVLAGPAIADAVTPARAITLPATVAPAVEAYQRGDPAPLAREFAAPAVLDSVIGDYARLLLSDALARRGDVTGARAAAIAVADRHPDSRLAPGALIQAAVLASHAGDDAAAQLMLKRVLESYPDAAEGPQALYMLGQVTAARGQPETAALAYRQVMILAPATAYADGAADRLAALAATGTPTPPLSITQRIDRAERLLRGGVPKTAADEAERIVSEARDPGIVLRALEVVAEGAQRLGRWEAAARAKELAVARASTVQKPKLQLEQGRLLLRAGQRHKALALFTAVAAAGSEAEASEALYQQARTLDDLERDGEAATAYRALAARYPKREVAGAAMWRLGWLAYLRGDVKGAAQQWARLTEASGGRAYRTAAIYWRARATEQLTGPASARRLYAQAAAEAPRGYYGMLSLDRMKSETGGEAATGDGNGLAAERAKARGAGLVFPADPAAALAEDPGFARVELLRRIGLVEYAWQELEDVVHRATGDTVRLYGFSSAYVRDERFHMALRIFRRHFAGLAASDDPALPRAFWEMLYPLGWGEDIGEAARRAGLDPFLVAAVVREESSFYPRALSRAGARGLMQLMPATARPMAELRGLPFNAGDLLDDPGANLEMGAAFLSGLVKEFGDVRLAVAAYNAGPGRLRQWWKARRTSDVEAFVEQIPYDETRQYVKRVMLSWREYTRIYAEP